MQLYYICRISHLHKYIIKTFEKIQLPDHIMEVAVEFRAYSVCEEERTYEELLG